MFEMYTPKLYEGDCKLFSEFHSQRNSLFKLEWFSFGFELIHI